MNARWILLAVISGCNIVPTPVSPLPDGELGDCVSACANLQRLGCPGGEGSPGYDDTMGTADDVPCAEACEDVQAGDPSMGGYMDCQARASSCDAADRCLEVAR